MIYLILFTLLMTPCLGTESAEDEDLEAILDSLFGTQNKSEPGGNHLEALLESIFSSANTNKADPVKRSITNGVISNQCTTKHGESGVCVPYNRCLGVINEAKESRVISMHNKECKPQLELCCPTSKLSVDPAS